MSTSDPFTLLLDRFIVSEVTAEAGVDAFLVSPEGCRRQLSNGIDASRVKDRDECLNDRATYHEDLVLLVQAGKSVEWAVTLTQHGIPTRKIAPQVFTGDGRGVIPPLYLNTRSPIRVVSQGQGEFKVELLDLWGDPETTTYVVFQGLGNVDTTFQHTRGTGVYLPIISAPEGRSWEVELK